MSNRITILQDTIVLQTAAIQAATQKIKALKAKLPEYWPKDVVWPVKEVEIYENEQCPLCVDGNIIARNGAKVFCRRCNGTALIGSGKLLRKEWQIIGNTKIGCELTGIKIEPERIRFFVDLHTGPADGPTSTEFANEKDLYPTQEAAQAVCDEGNGK